SGGHGDGGDGVGQVARTGGDGRGSSRDAGDRHGGGGAVLRDCDGGGHGGHTGIAGREIDGQAAGWRGAGQGQREILRRGAVDGEGRRGKTHRASDLYRRGSGAVTGRGGTDVSGSQSDSGDLRLLRRR